MDLLQVTARTTIGWMIYGLLEGTALALFVWLLLRLLPRQNAGTRFIFWFSALLAMFFLPLLGALARPKQMAAFASSHASNFRLITLPISWAMGIFVVWALMAAVNLSRVVAALWQINKLRRNSEEVDQETLGPEIAQLMRGLRRPVALLLSDQIQVPTAIGFLKPAVVLPRWFISEISQQELKHVLVHELSHLNRGDDWTNLAQKLIKALLFFHPSAWWVEQKLSLEREMACDDEVLRQTASPMDYAQCLKRVAEKSFLRKQMALAQAVAGRMRQVTLRVAQILDGNRSNATGIWKPALPVMVLAAALCGFSAWTAPALVAFTYDSPHPVSPTLAANDSRIDPSLVKEVKASFVPNLETVLSKTVLSTVSTGSAPPQKRVQHHLTQHATSAQQRTQMAASRLPKMILAATQQIPQPELKTYVSGDYVVQTAQFSVTMAGGQGTLQVQMWQVNVLVPANDHSSKPIPRKKI